MTVYLIKLQNGNYLSWKTLYEIMNEKYNYDSYNVPVILEEIEAKELAFMFKGNIELWKFYTLR